MEQQAQRLNRLYQEFRETRDDLDMFLDAYYDRIGAHLATLLRNASQGGTADISGHSRQNGATPDFARPVASRDVRHAATEMVNLETEMRELYLLLVRRLHPDVAPHCDPEPIKSVTSAYKAGRLGDLWKIHFSLEMEEIRRLPARAHASCWQHYHQRFAHMIDVMETRLRALHASPEYLLHQRIFVARLRGEDLLARIVEHVQDEVNRHQRRLQYIEIREKLWQETR